MKVKMNKNKRNFPLYLGIFAFIISILAVSIKFGQKNMIATGRLLANQDEAIISLKFTSPDIISVNFVSTKEISGSDLVLTYDKNEIEILPSSLSGISGYITTGGSIDKNKGLFSFSAVNSDNPIKSGIFATFRIKGTGGQELDEGSFKVDFVVGESKVYGQNLESITGVFNGLIR